MPSRTSALTNSKAAKRQREVIEHDKDFARDDLMKACHRRNRFAATVHISHWLNEQDITKFAPLCAPFTRFFPSHPSLRRQQICEEKADIVAGMLIFRAGIAQAGHQA